MSDISRQERCAVGIAANAEMLQAVVYRSGAVSDRQEILLDTNKDFLSQLGEFVRRIKEFAPDAGALGIAFPGLVKNRVGEVSFSVHFPSIKSFDLRQMLQDELGLPVNIENDANAGAFAEYRLGAGRGAQSLFYASFGKGVGGAIMLDGKIWRGANGFAGEFGHIIVGSEGMILEDIASERGIIRRSKERLLTDNTSSLSKFKKDFTMQNIIDAAAAGDDFSQMMIERTGVFVGMSIAGIINLLDVERVILNGEIITADGLFIEAVRESAKKWSFEPLWESTQIVAAELGTDAVAIGAALLAFTAENAD